MGQDLILRLPHVADWRILRKTGALQDEMTMKLSVFSAEANCHSLSV